MKPSARSSGSPADPAALIVLGIDPGSRYTGYGVVRIVGGTEELVEHGVIRLDVQRNHELRLKLIYDRLSEVIARSLPDEAAVEMPVYGRNPQSMLKLGRAQASAMLAVLNRGLPITQYTPKEVKKAVTGNGNAAKEQVRYMIRSILAMRAEDAIGLDASDALAVALCHAHRHTKTGRARHDGWAGFLRDHPDRLIR